MKARKFKGLILAKKINLFLLLELLEILLNFLNYFLAIKKHKTNFKLH